MYDFIINILYFTAYFIGVFTIYTSLRYFFLVKVGWRWIKLFYALNSFLTLVLISGPLITNNFLISPHLFLFVTILLLSTLASGSITALAKLNVVNNIKNFLE
jgi:hypothetical protein